MTNSQSVSKKSAPVVVVSIGSAARAVCAELVARQDAIAVHVAEGQPSAQWAEPVIEALRAHQTSPDQLTGIPTVLIAAAMADSGGVVTLLRELRDLESVVRPRVWPTFIEGQAGELVGFDAALDEARGGLCDVVLVTAGAPSAADQVEALGAWLQVKGPAPASVLGDLPDSAGRICRYVALGASTVTAQLADAVNSASAADSEADPDVDVDVVAADIAAELKDRAEQSALVAAASEAAAAIGRAGELGAPADVLRADKLLIERLANLRTGLEPDLREQAAELVSRAVREPVKNVSKAEATEVDSETAAAADSAPANTDRSESIAALLLLTSKGGLAKMFGRSRMAGAAQAAAAAAQADVDRTVGQIVAAVSSDLGDQITAVVEAERLSAQARREQENLDRETAAVLRWDKAMDVAKETTKVWPSVEAGDIRRAWGGKVPAPRTYVVTTAEAGLADNVTDISDTGGVLTIIDLRTQAPTASPATPGVPSAVVLVAQYGLPLTALV